MSHTVTGHSSLSPLASTASPDRTNVDSLNYCYGFNKKQCNGIASCMNDKASVTLKQAPPQSPLATNNTNVIMTDIPLRHSSHTRTLLPGLRRKSSIIRHSTPRSRWQSVTEQIQQHRSFSFLFSTCITRSVTASKNGNRPDMTGSPPIIIKPPKHTQRILKYDPITGNAYNNNNDDKNSGSRNPCQFISIAALGRVITRNKALLSIWKMTFLLSFVYINLHLVHLQQEHHQLLNTVLSSLSDSELPYSPPQPQHHHHRSLRGSVTAAATTTSHDENNHEYYYYHHHHNHSIPNNRKTTTTNNAPAKKQVRSVVEHDLDLRDDDTADHHDDDDVDVDDDDSMSELLMDTLAMATAMQ